METSPILAHYRKNLRLALPIVAGNLGHMLVTLADSIMVGQVGTVPLAAASLANSIFMVVLAAGLGVSFGITPLVAAADGRGHTNRFARLLTNSLVVYTATGVLLFIVIFSVSRFIHFLDQPPEVAALAVPYLNIIMLSLVPLMIFQSCKQFAEGLSLTSQAMIIVLGASLLNVVLNYILIFGHLGFPALGLNGAGWATLISRVLMAAAMAGFLALPAIVKRYRLSFSFRNYSGILVSKLLKLGVPIGMQMTFEVGAFAGAAVIIGWLGAQELAAHQIALTLAATTYMMAQGLAAAATVRVGNQLGLRNYHELRKAVFSIYQMVIFFMGFMAVFFILGRNWLPAFFVESAEVISIASGLLIIAGLFQLFDGMQVTGLGALRGMEDVTIPTAITLIAYFVIGLPGGYILAFPLGMGVNGMWMGLLSGLGTAALFLTWRFHLKSKARLVSQPSE
ncbi:MAG: MATE family efflux transporter [Bacteroidia bacterium]